MPTTGTPAGDLTAAELLAEERTRYRERTANSAELAGDRRQTIHAGVCSTFRAFDPYPIHADRAVETSIYDVDGNEYLDFALNNGTQLVGHSHPALDEAAMALAEKLAAGPPIAQGFTKRAMLAGRDDTDAGLEIEAQAFGLLMDTEDLREGLRAFMNDDEPEFTGE